MLRALLPVEFTAAGYSRHESRGCRICREPTAGKKPYCLAHVLHHPYAKKVAQEVAERAEVEALARAGAWRAIPLQGVVVQELLDLLDDLGSVKVKTLPKLLGLTPEEGTQVALGLLEALQRAKLAVVWERRDRHHGYVKVAALATVSPELRRAQARTRPRNRRRLRGPPDEAPAPC